MGAQDHSSAVSKMKNQKFRKLDVWNKAMEFIEEIYIFTNKFPKEELYGLTSQIRRAATSIALNIAEGSGANSDPEFNRFLTMALRSNYELMCGLEIVNRLRYCSTDEKEVFLIKSDELSAMLFGLKKKLIADS